MTTGTFPPIEELVAKSREALASADWSAPEYEEVVALAKRKGISNEAASEEVLREVIAAYQKMEGIPYVPIFDPAKVEEAFSEPEPTDLVLPTPGEPYWWDDPKQAAFIDHFIETRRKLGNAFEGGLIITGWAGMGKTGSVRKAAERAGLRLTKMDCATVTDPQKWFGRREVGPKGTTYHASDFVEGVERGDVVLLDDLTRLHAYLHNPIQSLLDGSNEVHLSDLNVTIKRHPETVFIATANIGPQFSGTHRLDWAMRGRFPYTLERPTPPREAEIAILTSATGCDEDGATNLVDIAERSRAMFATGDLRTPIDTRTLVAAAFCVAMGMNETEAMERTAVHLYDPDANGIASSESDRTRIRSLINQKLGQQR